MKEVTEEALVHFVADAHDPDAVIEVVIHVDGGGMRPSADGNLPATWGAVVSTVAEDGAFAFSRFFG